MRSTMLGVAAVIVTVSPVLAADFAVPYDEGTTYQRETRTYVREYREPARRVIVEEPAPVVTEVVPAPVVVVRRPVVIERPPEVIGYPVYGAREVYGYDYGYPRRSHWGGRYYSRW
jgi:hypothetical protein